MSIIIILLELSPFCAIICLYLSWNQWKTAKTPRVHSRNSLFNQLATQYCSDFLKNPYRPTIWAFSARIQNAYSMRWPRRPAVVKTQYLEVGDGGLVGLMWPQPCGDNNSLGERSPVVVFISNPLLVDNSLQPYIKCALQSGFRPAVYLARESQRLPKIRQKLTSHRDENYNSVSPECDFSEAIEYINNKYPEALIYVVGLSYGNATLFKFLTAGLISRHVTGAASISPVWQKQSSGWPVSKSCEAHNGLSLPGISLRVSQSCDSFLRKITRKRRVSFQGDKNASQATTMPNEVFGKFKRLLTPLVVIYAKDDPVMSTEQRNRVAAMWKNSDLLLVVEASNGGHVGFLQGFLPQSWAAMLVFQYFDAVGKFGDSTVNKLGDATVDKLFT